MQVWDMARHLEALLPLTGTSVSSESEAHARPTATAPCHMHRHPNEGYALDWSGVSRGRLASGDCSAGIQVAEPSEGGRWAVGAPFQV